MATLPASSSFMEMMNEIVSNDQKQQSDGFVNVAPIAFWTQIFAKYFLHANNPHHDDLLFYVKKTESLESQNEVVVYRRESMNAPGLGDPAYDWTETVYLNMIIQQMEYTLTCAICTKAETGNPKGDVTVHKKVSQHVYASPSRHNMENKEGGTEMSYPNIFFTIDSFDEVWSDLILHEGEIVCVEVIASDKSKKLSSVIFLGSVKYDSLVKVYERRTKAPNKFTQFMTLGLYKTSDSVEFVRMKGPGGKGYAEMAIQKSNSDTAHYKSTECASDESKASSSTTTSASCSLHSSKSESSINEPSGGNKDFPTAVYSKSEQRENVSLPSSPQRKRASIPTTTTALKTHLTYVTLPWHKIILDILQTYEKPGISKRPALTKGEGASS
uniref:Uncharacterized protein n=1 Tax=Ciona intestinalis TaxID=7719 RepID=F6ZYG1_CIOIN|nr:uncharacterized protein KIAA0930 homolog [Ciona intestinalis]|eukprot:XP_026695101.1 uncharacterized protein KIAA0930 homolog [Ciona intestinalis]